MIDRSGRAHAGDAAGGREGVARRNRQRPRGRGRAPALGRNPIGLLLDETILLMAALALYIGHPLLVLRSLRRLRYLPNPARPRCYADKMFWRKVVDRAPLHVTFCDKLAAKAWIMERCPDLPQPQILWVGSAAAAIPDAILAGDVVVKANHGYRFNYFVADGKVDRARLAQQTARWLSRTHGRSDGQWAYGQVPRKLFVEERLPLGRDGLPGDIRVHVCSGEVAHAWVEDVPTHRGLVLDARGQPLPARASGYTDDGQTLPFHPSFTAVFNRAAAFARRLGQGLDHARFDFLVVGDEIYGGEITVYTGAGYEKWTDPSIAERLDRLWDLRDAAFFRRPHRGLRALYALALRRHLDRTPP